MIVRACHAKQVHAEFAKHGTIVHVDIDPSEINKIKEAPSSQALEMIAAGGLELVGTVPEDRTIYEFDFNGSSLSSGIYFYRLETEKKVENRKMVLVQ